MTTSITKKLKAQADAIKLGELVKNLVHNSITYGPDKNTINIAAHAKGDNVQIIVSDTGPGIDKDQIPFLFKKPIRGGKKNSTAAESVSTSQKLLQNSWKEICNTCRRNKEQNLKSL